MYLTHGSPSPAYRSGHPSSVFWQHLQWHCEDEKKLHIEMETFPLKRLSHFYRGFSTWPLSFHSAWLLLEDKKKKKKVLLCMPMYYNKLCRPTHYN